MALMTLFIFDGGGKKIFEKNVWKIFSISPDCGPFT
jgi:hypothetical protein